MIRIFLTAAVIVAVMFAVADGRVLAGAGLVGSCRAVAAPSGQAGDWQACRAGRLEGRPDLTQRSCVRQGFVGRDEYWFCAAPLDNSPGL